MQPVKLIDEPQCLVGPLAINYRPLQHIKSEYILFGGQVYLPLPVLMREAVVISKRKDKQRKDLLKHWIQFSEDVYYYHGNELHAKTLRAFVHDNMLFLRPKDMAKTIAQYLAGKDCPDHERLETLCSWLTSTQLTEQIKNHIGLVDGQELLLVRSALPDAKPCDMVPTFKSPFVTISRARAIKNSIGFSINGAPFGPIQLRAYTYKGRHFIAPSAFIRAVLGLSINLRLNTFDSNNVLTRAAELVSIALAYRQDDFKFKETEHRAPDVIDSNSCTLVRLERLKDVLKILVPLTEGKDWDKFSKVVQWLEDSSFPSIAKRAIKKSIRLAAINESKAAQDTLSITPRHAPYPQVKSDYFYYRGSLIKRPPKIAPWDMPLSNVRPNATKEAIC